MGRKLRVQIKDAVYFVTNRCPPAALLVAPFGGRKRHHPRRSLLSGRQTGITSIASLQSPAVVLVGSMAAGMLLYSAFERLVLSSGTIGDEG